MGTAGQLYAAGAYHGIRQGWPELPPGYPDENAYPLKKNQPLEAQQSHDLELGASYASALQKLTARVFRHQLVNEIFYDQSVYANVNLAPTRRQGFELDAEQRINADWTLNGTTSTWMRASPKAATTASRWYWCRKTR
jgi:outer membrane cobalamin receptor